MSEHSCNGKVIEALEKDRDLWKHRAEELARNLNRLHDQAHKPCLSSICFAKTALTKFDALKAGQEKGEK